MRPIKTCISKAETIVLQKYLDKALPLEGDIAECGVCWGGTSRRLALWAPAKTIYMFDIFDKLPNLSTPEEKKLQKDWIRGNPYRESKLEMTGKPDFLDAVISAFEVHNITNYKIIKGMVGDTLPKFDKPLCFIHADLDLYSPMVEAGKFATRLLAKGGYYIAHDYKYPMWIGVERSVKELVAEGNFKIIEEVNTQCVLQKL